LTIPKTIMSMNNFPTIPSADKPYVKENSFNSFIRIKQRSSPEAQIQRGLNAIHSAQTVDKDPLLAEIKSCLSGNLATYKPEELISELNCDEMSTISQQNIIRYLKGRYRYNFYPKLNRLHEFPPYLQIELSSACNYRCKFCFQTDSKLSKKSSGHIGTMNIETFRRVVDLAAGNVDFVSMASRGEPLLCKQLPEAFKYMDDKFLCAKMNTNASMLTEEKCHTILSSGLHTLVFSADASEPGLYAELRVNGSLQRVYSNIGQFNAIRAKYYPDSKLITRVSGVLFSEKQSFESLVDFWSPLVDQISMVRFCAWNDTYNLPANHITEPCTELWRRMYVWFDGTVNPCEADYLSNLSVGSIYNVGSLSELWQNASYDGLRRHHLSQMRSCLTPCKGCTIS